MSYKYTLKDVLLEAGMNEYNRTPDDHSWVRSEKHKKAMRRLFDKQSEINHRFTKGISIAAAVAVLFGVSMAIKPVREPVLHFIGSIFNQGEETRTGENTYITEPDETENGIITTVTETETETETPEETEPEYEDEIERYLLMLEKNNTRQKAFDYLYNKDRVEKVFDYCVNSLLNKDKSDRILNCAGEFLYYFDDLTSIYPFILEYNDDHMQLDIYDSTTENDVRYVKWFDKYFDTLRAAAAETLKKDALLCSYQYRLMTLSGFDNWLIDAEPAEAVERTLTKLFELFNCVYSGIPLPDDEIIPLSEPYPESLLQQTEEIWGDEKREFVMSSYTLQSYQSMFEKYADPSLTETVIGQTKYFIIAQNHVYLTRAKETDKDAHTYEFLQIAEINEPQITWSSIYGSADVLHDKKKETYSFFFDEAYLYNGVKCIMDSGKIIDYAMDYRGIGTVKKAINALKTGRDIGSLYPSSCVHRLKDITADYILQRYFTEENELERAAMSRLYYEILRRGGNYDVFNDLMDEQSRNDLLYYDGKWIANYDITSNTQVWAPFLSEFVKAVKPFAEARYRVDIEENFAYTYKALEAAGFDNYKPEPLDIAYRARYAVSDVLRLAVALHDGIGIYDDTSVTYGDGELFIGEAEYPPALAEAIKGSDIKYWTGISTQAQGFKTVEDWKEYYKKILPEDVVDGAVKSGNHFIIADGIVYTGGYDGMLYPELDMLDLKQIGEKDGRAVLATNVNIPFGMGSYKHEVTFEVVEEDGQIRIVGGTFVEIFLQDGATKGKAALSVYEAIYAQEILLECNYNTKAMRAYGLQRKLNNIDELRAADKYQQEFIDAEVPEDMFPLYMNLGWEESTSWKWALGYILPEKYYDILITNNKNVVMIGYYVLISTANVKDKNTPMIGSVENITVTDVYNSLEVISQQGDNMTVSLDFINKKAYTFEMTAGQTGYMHLLINGGTFLTEVLEK